MWKSVKHYLKILIRDGHRWQYLDVNGKGKAPLLFFSDFQIFLLFVTGFAFYILPSGFNNDFVGYIIAALSIFIGLFLTLIVSVFEKFQTMDIKGAESDMIITARLIRVKNFIKQFIALISYLILIALLLLFVLGLNLLIKTDYNFKVYSFIENFNEIDLSSVKLFLVLSAVFLCRLFSIYFLLNFIYIAVFGISSFYNFMQIELNKNKIQKAKLKNETSSTQ